MLGWVRHLPLQCLESVSHDIGFGQAKVDGELVQLTALAWIQIHLEWLGNAFGGFIMTLCHDGMIVLNDASVNPEIE